jgi:hypothetical protein
MLLKAAFLTSLLLTGQTPVSSTLEFKDQAGQTRRVTASNGSPTLVIIVTARRLRTVRPWQRAVLERWEDLQAVLIADVPSTPPPDYERVAKKLSQRVPEGVSVLIDIDRVWASEFDLDTSKPQLLVLDIDGELIYSLSGRWKPELEGELFSVLEPLMEEP